MSNLSRRSLVTTAAALPALAVPAVALASKPAWQTPALAEVDPIFAAIERFKDLDALHAAAIDATDAAGFNSPDYEAVCKAQREACRVACAAGEAIFAMVPTTLAAMRAKIDFAFSVCHVTDLLFRNGHGTGDDIPHQFIETFYEAARMMAVRS